MQSRKTIFPLLLLALIQFCGYAQEQVPLLQKKITLYNQITTLENALRIISEKGGFTFTYGNRIPLQQNVTLRAGERTLREILDEILRDVPVEYTEKNGKILILPRKGSGPVVYQTVRGRIVDRDSGLPIPGVNVYLASPLKGTVTNLEGDFRLEEVPVGRHDLEVSCMGYEGKSLPDLAVQSGKETVLRFELEESIIDIGEVTIRHEIDKLKPVNDLAMVSAIPLSAEDLTYCPGSMNDISRVITSRAGVASPNDGQNLIIIRGNSPKGILWRLEGIEIPNMNHFGEIGSSGGGISMLSNNMIGRSDFFTGAFPAEYGNALSGVLDINMRTGNNEKHEQTFQIGVIGTEFMAEGPISRRSGATYIAQYRFYTLALISRLGLMDNTPDFSDLSFKFRVPTNHSGTFTVFGIGGRSHEKGGSRGYDWHNDVANLGVSHEIGINEFTRIRTIAAFSFWKYRWDKLQNIGNAENPIDFAEHDNVTELIPRISVTLDKKLSPRHKLRTGLVYSQVFYDSFMGWYSDTLAGRALDPGNPLYSTDIDYEQTYVDARGNSGILQAYINWKYRIFPSLTLNSGIHYIQLMLNHNHSLEPRVSLSWQFLPGHNLSAGFGIHSRRESYTLYTGGRTLHDGEKVQINKDLELTKSQHYILGYQYEPGAGWLIRTEAYYQYLYDIPVYPFPPWFSTINFDYGFEGNILVNSGTGYNKGVELTVEKLISNGYSLLLTGSLYESRYKNYMGQEFPTKYDGSFTGAGMFTREFALGPGGRNVLGLSARFIWTGGFRELPIDLQASINAGREIRVWDDGFSEKLDNYFRIDLMGFFRRNRPGYSGEWKLELINLTNRKNMLRTEYHNSTHSIEVEYQNTLLPVLTYRIQF
jgi:hypothetical protein